MSATRTALYDRLVGDATLTDLLGTPAEGFTAAIYHQVAPQDAESPFVVFQRVPVPRNWQFGGAYLAADLWMVKAVNRGGASVAEAIADRIDAILTDQPLVIDDATCLAIYQDAPIDYPEIDGADQWHHCGGNYRVVTQPS